MTRKSFAGLAALLGLGAARVAVDSRGTSSGLGRGWTQVSPNRAVLDEYGRWTGDRIRQANAVNGVGSSKRRKAVRGH